MHKIMEEFAWKFYSRWFDLRPTCKTQVRRLEYILGDW